MIFPISDKFKKSFQNILSEDQKFVIFKTHKDLHEFIKRFGDKTRNKLLHDKNFIEELFLLKSFDRAFWMMKDLCEDCIFESPKKTNSFANLKEIK